MVEFNEYLSYVEVTLLNFNYQSWEFQGDLVKAQIIWACSLGFHTYVI